MNGEVGRGVYMCASVLMARATRNHRSGQGGPCLRYRSMGAIDVMLRNESQTLHLSALGVIARHDRYARDIFVPVFVGTSEQARIIRQYGARPPHCVVALFKGIVFAIEWSLLNNFRQEMFE